MLLMHTLKWFLCRPIFITYFMCWIILRKKRNICLFGSLCNMNIAQAVEIFSGRRHGAIYSAYTVECRYNAVQFITILPPALRWQEQNVNQTSKSQHTPHTSPSRASYGVSIVRIWEKINRVITAPHCSLCHSCGCQGDKRSRVITSHGINLSSHGSFHLQHKKG